MSVDEIITKIKLRVNKLDSQDYDNIEIWQILEAYNRAALLFMRSQLHGINQLMEGDEGSKRRIDDFQMFLTSINYVPTRVDKYLYVAPLPDDYIYYKRTEVDLKKGCCEKIRCITYLIEEANLSLYQSNPLFRSDFEWGEVLVTLKDDLLNVHTDGEFEVQSVRLTYYRKPATVTKAGHYSTDTFSIASSDTPSEFNRDTDELIISYAAALILGDVKDIEGFNVMNSNKTEFN